jgi:hypothetical protein
MKPELVAQEKRHLADMLEAIQRCVYFLDAASASLEWPLKLEALVQDKKNTALFNTLATINERFAKLQDTLGAAMRHSMGLLSESAETFLKVLAFYEKVGVIDSIADWQTIRFVRNLAAHSYETDYAAIAEHFNTLHDMQPTLYQSSGRFLMYCRDTIGIEPASVDFVHEFAAITGRPPK